MAIASCTSDSQAGTFTASGNSSPLSVTVPFKADQQITCTVTETAHGLTSGPSAASTPTYLYPNPSGVIVVQNNLVSVTVSFTGDGATGATFSTSCTSSAGGGPVVVAGPSPVIVGGFTNLASQVITCGVTETAHSLSTTVGGAGIMFGHSGPGCIPSGTVAAPGQISAAAQAFPGAEVSWAPVATDCLVGYLVTPTTGTPVFVTGYGTTTLVKGPFAFGSNVGFTVAAVTGSGIGPQSVDVNVTIGTPAAPHAVTATHAGKGAIKVAFKTGTNNGAAISGFVATCGSKSSVGKASPLVVTGLKTGKSYTCTVTATNSRGTGAAGRSKPAKA